ncbi:sulfite exporter TauE/SafE family protein [Cryptosporangium phraense]|uniref:Probable membrane transporter protein n=1 Tax=Cryptosporangium phraense TaxID=2593070 RepID=A0A545AR29_9ACTN|nr:sulfite exporter TauE/SafE family protein [Cryptosporangium phraense]TQS43784.1 sulfite exporter TauE/SafE family protein [Cryptosporangium phraense]
MTFLLLVVAGFAAGLTGTIAGLASLVSYPALLAIGLPPVSANVTNTVALLFNSFGAVLGSRPELTGHWRRALQLASVSVLGGAVGGALLLWTPSDAFEKIVPILIGGASIAILARRPAEARSLEQRPGWPTLLAIFLIGIYGGYFGAAAGVLMLAVLLAIGTGTLARAGAYRNLVLGAANGIAAVGFALFGPVVWSAALPLALGFFVGGRLGPVVVRHSPADALRVVIALAGVGLAVYLAVDAY